MFDSDFVEEYEEGHDTFVQTGGVLVLEEVSLEGCKEERAKQGEATRGEEKKYVKKLHPLVLSLLLQKAMAVVLKLLLCCPLQETGGSKMDCLQSHQEELDNKVSFTCKISNTQSHNSQPKPQGNLPIIFRFGFLQNQKVPDFIFN